MATHTPIPIITPDPSADEARRRGLRQTWLPAVVGGTLIGTAVFVPVARARGTLAALAWMGAAVLAAFVLEAVLGWTAAMALTRLAATVAVAEALGIPHPFLAALVILPAIDVASALPLTPGNVGVGSGAVAVALASA